MALGDFDQHAGCGVVDFERGLLVLFAGRIADDGGEVDDGIDATNGGNHVLNVAAIADAHLEVRMAEDAAKRFVTVDEAVNDAHFAAGFEKLANQAGADVAGAAENENGAFGIDGAASANFVTLLQQRFCEAREREADDRQHREEEKREARDQVGAEEEVVDGEQREDADAGAAHHDDHLVAADVGARTCVEPVQQEHEREHDRDAEEVGDVVGQRLFEAGRCSDRVTAREQEHDRNAERHDHADLDEREVGQHAR